MKKLQNGAALILVFLIIVIVSVVGIGAYVYFNRNSDNAFIKFTEETFKSAGIKLPNGKVPQERKTRHFLSSSPEQGDLFASFPYNVTIDFKEELFDTSEITLSKDGVEIPVDKAILDDNKKTMRLRMPVTLEDGTYTVNYKECLSDGSCETGYFSFILDSTKKDQYKVMTDQTDISISLQKLSFNPEKIIVKKGTKVTWVNEESTNHLVNSDPYITHTNYTGLNSDQLAPGEKFTYSFFELGEFPYHCSLHFPQMTGRVIVVE